MTLVHDVAGIDGADVARYGGKAAGLARMRRLGMPVPPAFVIETSACRDFREHGGRLPGPLLADVRGRLKELESLTGRTFGAGSGVPLLVSVRSGAEVSMPGMMDTVLNLGLDARSVLRLAQVSGDAGYAVDTWARFWSMYADTVLDVDPGVLREQVRAAHDAATGSLGPGTAQALESAITGFLEAEGCDVTTDPWEQLVSTIGAVFGSWDSRRAKAYRAHHAIPDDLGTAVTVQAMVFGNLGSPAGSGVAFTRDPSTGRAELFGEYLDQGQGEDVVAGTATPAKLQQPGRAWEPVVRELTEYGRRLEREYHDALDIEFTVEAGTLYLLQVRPAKRTAAAAVHLATELAAEGLISEREALGRVSGEQVRLLVSPRFDEAATTAARNTGKLLTQGIPASPGHGSGRAVLDPDRAATRAAAGDHVVLLRPTTSPQDLRGMLAAQAVVTARGGAVSHAAVVSRALDKPCVVGCSQIEVRPDSAEFVIDGHTYPEGFEVSVDGATGEVFAGILPRTVPQHRLDVLHSLLDWADRASGAEVWVETPAGARGPGGVGVVGITDLLISAGRLDGLIGAIEAYSADPTAPGTEVEAVVERDVHEVCLPVLRAAQGTGPIDLRIPLLTSLRARRMISEWAGLAPHVLLPLRPRRLLGAYLRAVDRAAQDAGHDSVTLLIGGVTAAAELGAYAEMARSATRLKIGAVLANPAALEAGPRMAAAGHALWVDLPEVVRTLHGYPEELLFTVGELTSSGALGDAEPRPGVVRSPLLARLLTDLVEGARGRCRLGVDLGGADIGGLATDLYDLGFRVLTSSPAQTEELRLILGQHATSRQNRE